MQKRTHHSSSASSSALAEQSAGESESPASSGHSAARASRRASATSFARAGAFAQVIVAIIAVIGLVYVLKLVLVTALISILLAFVLEPLVSIMKRWGVPRWLGALMAVLLGLALTGFLAYFSYNRAVAFVDQLPAYSGKLRGILGKLPSQATEIDQQSRSVIEGATTGRQPLTVRVEEPSGLTRVISENGGTIMDTLLAIGFVPFLVYFMLTWKQHFQRATVRLFAEEHRSSAHEMVEVISAMIRSYIAGNVVIGIVTAGIFMLTFGLLKIEYFYFIAVISGFISLIPYLGLFLAMLAPLAAGFGVLDRTGIITIVVVVSAAHVLAVNLVYPKFVGKRLELNPVVVTLSLLFWSALWGAPGLVLAIPLLGSAKIICDHVAALNGLGAWLGESPTSA